MYQSFSFDSEREGRDLPFVVYYESLKRELKTKTIYGCRCDERLKKKSSIPFSIFACHGILSSVVKKRG